MLARFSVWLFAALLLSACRVTFPSDALYSCARESDCGGDGYVCVLFTDIAGYCCKPTLETCDGQDNDCDGKVDDEVPPQTCYDGPAGTSNVGACRSGAQQCLDGRFAGVCEGQVIPAQESCNGEDDDCDGVSDDGFDLLTNAAHCGGCNISCDIVRGQTCQAGGCVDPPENCADGIDNDSDGAIDCADGNCEGLACGTGCTCVALSKQESGCNDSIDNDTDGVIDCNDPNCENRLCQPAPSGYTCSGTTCACKGNVTPPAETNCVDGVDDDCDGAVDCADSSCAGVACGSGCECQGGGRRETDCNDSFDNDGDTKQDCADSDCNGASCGSGCQCNNGVKSETTCNDKSDNDGDGRTDCTDSQCVGKPCVTSGGSSGVCVERQGGRCSTN